MRPWLPKRWRNLFGAKTPWIFALAACLALGLALLLVDPLFVMVGLAALLVAAAILSQPYYGVLLYLFLLFARPGDMYPQLEPLRLTLLGVALLTVAYGLQVLVFRRVKPIASTPMIFMGLFLLSMLLSLPGSFYRTLTMDRFTEVIRIVYMTYLIVHLIDTVPRLQGFMVTLCLIMAYLSTMIVLRFFLHPDTRIEGKGGSGGIAGGFLGDGNDYALAQNVVLPWVIALLGVVDKKLLRLALIYSLVIGVFAVSVTYSRGGFLGLAMVFLGFYGLWMVRSRRYVEGVVVGAIAIALIVVGIFAFAPRDFVDRMTSIGEYEQDESALGRLDAWGAGVRMFVDHPFIGVGAGAFSIAYGMQYKPVDAVAANWREAHNVFFQVLGEMGFIGILTFYGLFFSIWVQAYKLRHTRLTDRRENRFFHAVRGAVLVSLLSWFVSSMFLSVAYYPHLFILVMVVTSLRYLARIRAQSLPEVVIVEEVEES